jgi:hypothetical protein
MTRMLRSYGELNKGFQAIGARVTDYSKRAFEDATRAFEQLVGAKSFEHVIEIQSQYAKKRTTPGLPRHRSSARCMPLLRAMPTSRSRKRWRRERPRSLSSPDCKKTRGTGPPGSFSSASSTPSKGRPWHPTASLTIFAPHERPCRSDFRFVA